MSQTKSQKLFTVRLRLPGADLPDGTSRRRDVRVKAIDNITAMARAVKRNPDCLGVIACVEGPEVREDEAGV